MWARVGRLAKRAASLQAGVAEFGIVLDVDGVLLRGRHPLPRTRDALQLLTNENGRFKLPTVFLTNGTNCMRAEKAERLSETLDVAVEEEQVVMGHSPLKMFTDYHDKHILFVGQGPVRKIAEKLGFKRVTTLDELHEVFNFLACTDFGRKPVDTANAVANARSSFRPIEGIVFLGEPVDWATALQLLLDVLLTGGHPSREDVTRCAPTWPHLPIIACNVDLVWMAEQSLVLPRLGHGAFLACLEALFSRLTRRELSYHALLGKPCEIGYMDATFALVAQASRLGMPAPTRVYVIGDNPESDIVGANLFDRQLRHHGGKSRFDHLNLWEMGEKAERPRLESVRRCLSVLVETGVFCEGSTLMAGAGSRAGASVLTEELSPREVGNLRRPTYVEPDLYAALRMIFARERYRIPL